MELDGHEVCKDLKAIRYFLWQIYWLFLMHLMGKLLKARDYEVTLLRILNGKDTVVHTMFLQCSDKDI